MGSKNCVYSQSSFPGSQRSGFNLFVAPFVLEPSLFVSFFAHFFQSVWAVCTITISLSSPPTQPVRSFLLTEEDATFVSIRFIEKIISRMWQKAKKRKLEVDPIVLQPWLQNFVENKGYSYAFNCGSWIYFLLCWNFTKVTHVSNVFVGNFNKFGIPNAWVARKTHVTYQGNLL